MRVLVLVKATRNSEAGVMPSEELFTEMAAFNEALVKAGVMVSGEGLLPSSQGKRVVFSGEERRVVDGPFSNPTELVAGFWIWKVKSMDEALEWARRCPSPMPGEESILELRPIASAEDFADAVSPELLEREERLRQRVEGS